MHVLVFPWSVLHFYHPRQIRQCFKETFSVDEVICLCEINNKDSSIIWFCISGTTEYFRFLEYVHHKTWLVWTLVDILTGFVVLQSEICFLSIYLKFYMWGAQSSHRIYQLFFDQDESMLFLLFILCVHYHLHCSFKWLPLMIDCACVCTSVHACMSAHAHMYMLLDIHAQT